MKFFGVVLGLKKDKFSKGLNEAGNEVKKFKEKTRGAGGGLFSDLKSNIAGALAAFTIGDIVERADAIQDLGERFNVPVEALQKIGLVAEQEGSSLESVAAAMNKVTIAQSQALEGNQQMRDHFAALGVTLEDLQTMSPDQLMAKIGKSSMNAANMVAVMGRNALELRNTLASLDGAKPEGVISKEDIAAIAQAKDEMMDLWRTMQAMAGYLLGKFAGAFSSGLQNAKEFFGYLGALSAGGGLEGARAERERMRAEYNAKNNKESKPDGPAAIKKTPDELNREKAENDHNQRMNDAFKERDDKLQKISMDKDQAALDRAKKFSSLDTEQRVDARRQERQERNDDRRGESRFMRDKEREFLKGNMSPSEKERERARNAAKEALQKLKDEKDPAKKAEDELKKKIEESEKKRDDAIKKFSDAHEEIKQILEDKLVQVPT